MLLFILLPPGVLLLSATEISSRLEAEYLCALLLYPSGGLPPTERWSMFRARGGLPALTYDWLSL